MPRPSTCKPETVDAICKRLARGEPLAQICRDEGMPSDDTVRNWAAADDDVARAIARARDLGADAIAEDCMRIVDETPPPGPMGGTDSGFVNWQRLRAETRLKLLAKWNPKRYGDRQHVEHSGKVGLESLVAGDEKPSE